MLFWKEAKASRKKDKKLHIKAKGKWRFVQYIALENSIFCAVFPSKALLFVELFKFFFLRPLTS